MERARAAQSTLRGSSWQTEQEVVFAAGGGERLFAETLNAGTPTRSSSTPRTSGFEPSPHWNYFGGFDSRKGQPHCSPRSMHGILMESVYILREYYQFQGSSPKQHIAPAASSLRGFVGIADLFADPSIFYARRRRRTMGLSRPSHRSTQERGHRRPRRRAPENNELLGMERILAALDEPRPACEPTLKIRVPRSAARDIAKPHYGVHNEGSPNLLWELRRARRAESDGQTN